LGAGPTLRRQRRDWPERKQSAGLERFVDTLNAVLLFCIKSHGQCNMLTYGSALRVFSDVAP
jgi:hypothetical protein